MSKTQTFHNILKIILLFSVYSWAGQGYSISPELTRKADQFFAADTMGAQRLLTQLSTADLQALSESLKENKNLKEKREFWLIQEFEKREATRISESRFFYLSLAIFLLILLLFSFLFAIFMQQQRLRKEIQ